MDLWEIRRGSVLPTGQSHILALDFTKTSGMEDITKMMLAKQAGVEDYVFKGINKIAGIAPVELTVGVLS